MPANQSITDRVQETLDEISDRYTTMQVAISRHDISTPGGANRISDYVRDLKAAIHTLEIDLELLGR